MDHIHYDDIATFEEEALDCLSLDALFLELLTGDLADDEEEHNDD
jgi:hypothetical protein